MWTPKRVLLLGIGALVFLLGYGLYAYFLGGIDGMPPLPEAFQPGEVMISLPEGTLDSDVDSKLRKAFGQECPQVKKRYRFEVRKKGLVIAAAEVSTNEPDGRVKMSDFSCAVFKDSADKQHPDINTITSDYAFITFDQPITNPTDMNKAKIIGGELRGHVTIINNSRTPETHDDVEVRIDSEPLFYDEGTARIWTDGYVKLIDKRSQPDPIMISGHGMEMLLTRDNPNDKKDTTRVKPKNDLSGVDQITLKSTVRMDLYQDAKSGFMASSSAQPKAPDPKKPSEKAHIIITTEGPFKYDMNKDVATFNSPESKVEQGFPDQVEVTRKLMGDGARPKDGEQQDHLLCDDLTLHFRRKVEPGLSRDKTGGDREIETAHATARPGMEVVVSLDAENLACYCADLYYQCPTAARGSRTVLKGEPLQAVKDGHKVKSRVLTLVAADQRGVGQRAVAEGPGQVDLYDRKDNKGYTTHALFKGLLTSEKYKEGERDLDLLTLTEDAVFIDDEHSQKLYGQRLQLWLESADTPSKATPAEPKQETTVGGPRQKPVRVEAYEKVKAEAPEFRIKECSSLKIRFKDDPRPGGTLPDLQAADSRPAPAPGTSPLANALNPALPGLPGQSAKMPDKPAPQQPPSPPVVPRTDLQGPASATLQQPKTEKQSEKPRQPIDLVARDVVVDVLRAGDKNELQELVAFGGVHVHQDGEKPEDKGVNIEGEMLDLWHYTDGDVLKVFGDKGERMAELQLGELFLLGPEVTIDQVLNTAAVEGLGLMHMPSNTTFEGGKPAKTGTRLTVHWTKNMIFNGTDADFHGGVKAYQEDSTLQSTTLQVALDRKVSLKQGQKEGEAAKVEKVIAHGSVKINDVIKDEKDKDKVVSQRRLDCHQADMDNLYKSVTAIGPGSVRALQYSSDDTATGPRPNPANAVKQAKPAPAKAPELMLTRIDFQDRMFSSYINNSTTRKSTFLGNVQVFHVPADSLDVPIDTHKLPTGGMTLRCGLLTVYTRQLPDKKSTQSMEAEKAVECWTADKFFRSTIARFDESTNIITFRGTPGNPATVTQIGPGGQRKSASAEAIHYNRADGTVNVEGANSISGWLDPREQMRPPDGVVALADPWRP